MLKRILLAAAITFAAFQIAPAQSDEKRFEAGGHFTVFRTLVRGLNFQGTRLVRSDRMSTVYGGGGRFGYNVTRHFTFEAEINFFPGDDGPRGGRKLQGLFGLKAGQRFERIGVFGKARPGFTRFQKGDYGPPTGIRVCPLQIPAPLSCLDPVATNNFTLDLGGVLEIYPSKRTIIRVDVGDTIIRRDARIAALRTFAGGGSFEVVDFAPKETAHKLQSSVGFGFRF